MLVYIVRFYERLRKKELVRPKKKKKSKVQGRNRTFEHQNHGISGVHNQRGERYFGKRLKLRNPRMRGNHPCEFGPDQLDGCSCNEWTCGQTDGNDEPIMCCLFANMQKYIINCTSDFIIPVLIGSISTLAFLFFPITSSFLIPDSLKNLIMCTSLCYFFPQLLHIYKWKPHYAGRFGIRHVGPSVYLYDCSF